MPAVWFAATIGAKRRRLNQAILWVAFVVYESIFAIHARIVAVKRRNASSANGVIGFEELYGGLLIVVHFHGLTGK